MARITQPSRLQPQDYVEAPEWFKTNFLYIYNYTNDRFYNELNGRLDVGSNIRAAFVERSFTTLSTYSTGGWNNITFQNTLGIKARGCFIAEIHPVSEGTYIPITNSVSVDWRDINNTITVYYISGLANSTKYNVTFKVE